MRLTYPALLEAWIEGRVADGAPARLPVQQQETAKQAQDSLVNIHHLRAAEGVDCDEYGISQPRSERLSLDPHALIWRPVDSPSCRDQGKV